VWHSTSTDLLTLPAHTLFSSQGVAFNINRPPHISCPYTVLLSGCSLQLQPTSSHCLHTYCSPLRVWHSTSTDLLTLPAHTLFSSQGVAFNINRPPHISCPYTVLLPVCSLQLQPTSSHCLHTYCSPLRVQHPTSTDLTFPAHTLFSSHGVASNFNRPPHISCTHTVLLSGCSIQLQPTSSHCLPIHCSPLRVWHSTSTDLLTLPAHTLFSSQGAASNFNRPPHIACPYTVLLSGCSIQHQPTSSHFLPIHCSPLRV